MTPERLMRIAAEAEALAATASAAGDMDEARRQRAIADDARVCAEWMERNRITRRTVVGNFSDVEFRRGMAVKIRDGIEIKTVGKQGRRKAARTYVVTVHAVRDGFVDRGDLFSTPEDVKVENLAVVWTGSRGEMCWADANDVVVVSG